MNFIRHLLVFFVVTEIAAGSVAIPNRLLKFVWKLPPTETISMVRQRGLSLRLLTSFIHETSDPQDTVGELVYWQKLDFYRQMSPEIVETILEDQYFETIKTIKHYDELLGMVNRGLLTDEMILPTVGDSIVDKARLTIIESDGLDKYLRDSSDYLHQQLERLEHVDSLTDQQQRVQALAEHFAKLERETFIKHLSLITIDGKKKSSHNLEKVINRVYLNRLTDYEIQYFFNSIRRTISSTPPLNFTLKQQTQNYLDYRDSIDHHYLKTTGIPAIKLLEKINYPLPTQTTLSKKDILSITNRYIDKEKYRAQQRYVDGKIKEIRIFAQ